MPEKPDHMVLIVDDEEPVGKALGRLMQGLGTRYGYAPSGQKALELMKSTPHPFSLILSDQRMPGMTGSEFLEKAREISPDTLRFLMTGYADMAAVRDAVNRGAIHHYIAKPWDNRILMETVRAGLDQYELIMENHRLFSLAKKQNAKLFALNTELKKRAGVYQKTILQQSKKIEKLNTHLEKGFENRAYADEIKALLNDGGMFEEKKLTAFYTTLLAKLFSEFQEVARRNGFEMPQDLH